MENLISGMDTYKKHGGKPPMSEDSFFDKIELMMQYRLKSHDQAKGIRGTSGGSTTQVIENMNVQRLAVDLSGLKVFKRFPWSYLEKNLCEIPKEANADQTGKIKKDTDVLQEPCVQNFCLAQMPQFIAHVVRLFSHVLAGYHDSHTHALSNNFKPDCTHHKTGTAPTIANVRFLGELKKRRGESAVFTADEMLHAIGLADRLLLNNPLRQFVYIYLTDLEYIQFFKVSSDSESSRVENTDVMMLRSETDEASEGERYLAYLFLASDGDLGILHQPTVRHFGGRSVDYLCGLGCGVKGLVMLAEFDASKKRKTQSAVKIFKKKEECMVEFALIHSVLDAVKACYEELPAHLKQVSVLLLPAQESVILAAEGDAILYPTVGDSSISFHTEHFCWLLDFLELLHHVGFIHRDFGPHNLVSLPGKAILPIDYGSLCRIADRPMDYYGTTSHASDSVYRQLRSHQLLPKHFPTQKEIDELSVLSVDAIDAVVIHPSDDLHSLIRTIRELIAVDRIAFKTVLWSCKKDGEWHYGLLREFWNSKLSGPWWEGMKAAADDADYARLRSAIREHINIE